MSREEGNKLIAEFMGAKYKSWKDGGGRLYRFEQPIGKTYAFPLHELSYHSSWEWLMPVVERIEGKEIDLGLSVVIKNNLCKIYRHKNSPYEVAITPLSEEATKINSTFLAVVHFIQWYNELVTKDKEKDI